MSKIVTISLALDLEDKKESALYVSINEHLSGEIAPTVEEKPKRRRTVKPKKEEETAPAVEEKETAPAAEETGTEVEEATEKTPEEEYAEKSFTEIREMIQPALKGPKSDKGAVKSKVVSLGEEDGATTLAELNPKHFYEVVKFCDELTQGEVLNHSTDV